MALWGSGVRLFLGSTMNLASAFLLEPFFSFHLSKGRREVPVAGLSGGNGIIAFLAPNLTADFGVDIATVAQLKGFADKFTVINLAAGTGYHKARPAIFDNRVLHMDESRVRNHLLEAVIQ